MRKVPRPFKMPWGKGIVVEEAFDIFQIPRTHCPAARV